MVKLGTIFTVKSQKNLLNNLFFKVNGLIFSVKSQLAAVKRLIFKLNGLSFRVKSLQFSVKGLLFRVNDRTKILKYVYVLPKKLSRIFTVKFVPIL